MLSEMARASFSYAVFTFAVDDAAAVTVPVGVALWSAERNYVDLRMLEPDEKILHVSVRDHFPFVSLVRDKIRHWIESKRLPYGDEQLLPVQDAWWQHIRNVLIHRVRISEPRPIDCMEPEQELEPLYQSIIAPYLSAREQRARVDHAISESLNGLSNKFKRHQALPGFHGREVKVLLSYKGTRRWVVIEGVNLATAQADNQTDAVVSKLQRVQEGLGNANCEFIVGYLASPEGLNGESVLVEWISEKTGAKTFDLTRERQQFRQIAGDLVAEAAMRIDDR